MTKQEKIREGIAIRIHPTKYDYVVADEILSYLHSQGVVIKVGEIKEVTATASHPETFIVQGNGIFLTSTERTAFVYKALKQAGYAAVEQLT